MKRVLLYIWQLPQNILGLCLLLYYKHERKYTEIGTAGVYWTEEMPSGISMGDYIIMNREDTEDGIRHEAGHHIQSQILGWLYLPVVGVLSGLGNVYDRWFHTEARGWSYVRSCEWYYNQLVEKWADRLGGVKRYYDYKHNKMTYEKQDR